MTEKETKEETLLDKISKEVKENNDIKEFLGKIELNKWAGCIIRGKSVKKEIAEKVLVQTSKFEIFTNSKELEQQIKEIFGLTNCKNYDDYNERLKKLHTDYNCLDINLFRNSAYACSSVGNSNWINWNGKIELTKNIGKYPCAFNIYNEWKIISKRFPELDLVIQMYEDEVYQIQHFGNILNKNFESKDKNNTKNRPGDFSIINQFEADASNCIDENRVIKLYPVFQLTVKNGIVTVQKPNEFEVIKFQKDFMGEFYSRLSTDSYYAEKIVDLNELPDILKRVKVLQKND